MKTSTLKTVAHSHVKSERKKFILTSVSIGAAAFFLAAVFILSQTLSASFRAGAGEQYQNADYVVNAPGSNLLSRTSDNATSNQTLTAEQVKLLRDSSDVEVVGSRSLTYFTISIADSSAQMIRAEALPEKPDAFPYSLEGEYPQTSTQVVIPSTFAESKNLSTGDTFSVEDPYDQPSAITNRTFTVSGIYEVSGSQLSPDARTIYFQQNVIDSVTAASGLPKDLSGFQEISVKLTNSGSDFPQELSNELSSGSQDAQPVITTKDEQVDLQVKVLSMGLDVITYVLLSFAGIALVVATFVIANTFRVLTTLRVSELAMLRNLGAHRRQLTTMLLREALTLGFLSSLVGVALAYLLALVAKMLVPQGIVIGFSPVAAVIGIGVGTLVTVLSSLLPALKAMKVSPLSALSHAQQVESEPAVSRKTLVLGVFLMLAGIGLFLVAQSAEQPFLILLATFVVAVGGLLLFPLLLWAILALLQHITGGSTQLTLALNQAVHSMQRTASTGLIVFLSTTLIAAVLMGYSTGTATNTKLSETSYPVAAQAPVFTDESKNGMHVDLVQIQHKEQELEKIEHVSSASIAAPAGLLTEGFAHDDEQLTAPPVYAVNPEEIRATITGIEQDLTENSILLPATYNKDLDGKKMVVSAGNTKVEVTAHVSESNFYMPLISLSTAEPLLDSADTQNFGYAAMVNTDSGITSAEAQSVLDSVASVTGAGESEIFGGINDRLRNEQIMQILVGIMLGLLSVATVIALIGVANTLSLSAYQRRRENAMLRSIGLSAKKLARLVALESLVIAAISVICGIAAGIALAMLGVQVLAVDGIEMTYSVNPFSLLVVAVFGTGLAYLASLLPAKKASRVSPVAALAIS